MQVKKTIMLLAIVLGLAQCALAEEVISQSGFTTGTSFEQLAPGGLVAGSDDYGQWSGSNYWETVPATPAGTGIAGATVTPYGDGAAYPYATTVRSRLFRGRNEKYLALDLEATLDRRVMPENVVTNILPWKLPDGLYADTLVKLTPCVSAPEVEGSDKIIVWLREGDAEVGTVTNLVVTAGRYAGGFDKVERCDYVIETPFVAADTWCRLTIRMIADISGKEGVSGGKAAAFTVYVDGKRVCGDDGYDIGSGCRADWILPEARVLIAERRLFPCLAPAGYDGATEVSRLTFDGQGAVDDVLVSSERPAHVVSDNVFTLNWDAGVRSMTCIVSNAAAVVTNEIDATALPRFRDFTFKTCNYAQVTVTNVVYDTVHDYSNGLWHAANDCTVTDNVFTYEGKSANPVGFVASTRDVISVGPGFSETFEEAKVLARAKGVKTIALQSDMIITSGQKSGQYNDKGKFSVVAGDDFILDLCGYTLQGLNGDPTVEQVGGRLRITDSSEGKTGRILPAASSNNVQKIAVQSIASPKNSPELIIDAGWYDGYVFVTNTQRGVSLGTCVVDGGCFTNAYHEADRFYLEQYVTNATSYFRLTADDYWATSAGTDGCIWSGEGTDARWVNSANWKGRRVPQTGDLAIFPRIHGGGNWSVDFGAGVDVKRFLLDADIDMSGTNEFSDVAVESGAGRLVGAGTVTFTGKLPGVLTGAEPSSEIRLGADWKGTVRISGVTKAQPLTSLMGWGNAGSKVEFAGVRGYLSDRANYAVPFGLVLTDAADGTPAWRNDTGYTGSVVSFPTLEGSGTFLSPANTREVLQVFQFRNVEAFVGTFNLGGKRLLLGCGAAASKARAGDFTFADAVQVRSGLGWQGVSAHFGSRLDVYGAFGDALMSYSGADPDVSGVTVTLTDAQGQQSEGRLMVDDNRVKVVTAASVRADDTVVPASEVASIVRNGSVIEVPVGSALTISGNDVIVNGMRVAQVSDSYEIHSLSPTRYVVRFNEAEVTPSLASFTVDAAGGKAVIRVDNAKPGFWYGLQTITSLAESWEAAPTVWQQASDAAVTFEPEVGDTAGFYRVIMTDKDPNGGEE